MSEVRQFDSALDTLGRYVTQIGDEVDEEIEGTAGGEKFYGYSCSHGTHTYLILGMKPWDYFAVKYPLNMDHGVALRRKAKQTDLPNMEEVEVTEADIQNAREELNKELNGMPHQLRRELRLNLIEMLSREGCVVDLDTEEEVNIHGFNIDRKVFAYEDSFNLSDFESAVQTVINLGWVGKEFIAENYGFSQPFEAPGSSGPDPAHRSG